MKKNGKSYALCVKNQGYPAALDIRKVYRVLPDSAAEKVGRIRIIDESGEDYLYPKSFFVRIAIPKAKQHLLRATG